MHWPGSSSMLIFGYLISLLAGALMLIHKLRGNKKEINTVSKNKDKNILDG